MPDSLFACTMSESRLPPGGELVNCTPKEHGCETEPVTVPVVSLLLTHKALISAQKTDLSLAKSLAAAVENGNKWCEPVSCC